MGKRELIALLCLSSWRLVIVEWLVLKIPRVCLQFVIVLFPDHTHLLFLVCRELSRYMFFEDSSYRGVTTDRQTDSQTGRQTGNRHIFQTIRKRNPDLRDRQLRPYIIILIVINNRQLGQMMIFWNLLQNLLQTPIQTYQAGLEV